MKQNEILQKVNELLGDNNDLIVLKGQLFYPQKAAKKETSEVYYTFCLKTLAFATNDAYNQRYNTYYCVMNTEVSNKYTDQDMQAMKGNEVILIGSITGRTHKHNDKIYNNNNSIYVYDLMITREIQKIETTSKKVVNL